MENPWISIKNVRFVRSRRQILDDISWEIKPGENWVVLGANGSGKTTLLQILAGYLWPTSGEVTVLGKRFGEVDLRALRRKIGWVGSFLQAQVPPSQKPLEFIVSGKYASLGIFEKPEPADFEDAAQLAARLNCQNILDSPYAVLSQGEKQRLLIARALIHKPGLLILDEPCGGLDLVSREQLLSTLESLGREPGGPSMILVTHYLEEIMPAFGHVFLLKSGRCAAKGEKKAILRPDLLTELFGIPIESGGENGRLWARVAARA
ncbi:MAG: ABC transporter ATP-binding protein [Syntrophobacteraceae bacterium]|nr:ABC transporter ATP-binding protein [Syntrophobacteraceae bacterium]